MIGTALALWPAILFDPHNLAAARQHVHARNGRNGPPMPHVWIDPDE